MATILRGLEIWTMNFGLAAPWFQSNVCIFLTFFHLVLVVILVPLICYTSWTNSGDHDMKIELVFDQSWQYMSGTYSKFTVDGSPNCSLGYENYSTDPRWRLLDHFQSVKGQPLVTSGDPQDLEDCLAKAGGTAGWWERMETRKKKVYCWIKWNESSSFPSPGFWHTMTALTPTPLAYTSLQQRPPAKLSLHSPAAERSQPPNWFSQ